MLGKDGRSIKLLDFGIARVEQCAETQAAAELCMSGRAADGYARYIKLVDRFLVANKFASASKICGHSLAFLFSNAVHALVACIAHEELPDVSTLVAALRRVCDACHAAAPKHFDGLVLAHFGLGIQLWLARDREHAAKQYESCIAAGRAAVEANAPLGEFAKNKLRTAAENLAVLRGELRLPPTGNNAVRLVVPAGDGEMAAAPVKRALCGACGKDFATSRCGRCLSVTYCDAVCQRADWRAHKAECKAPASS
jgi:hypothetical protein